MCCQSKHSYANIDKKTTGGADFQYGIEDFNVEYKLAA